MFKSKHVQKARRKAHHQMTSQEFEGLTSSKREDGSKKVAQQAKEWLIQD